MIANASLASALGRPDLAPASAMTALQSAPMSPQISSGIDTNSGKASPTGSFFSNASGDIQGRLSLGFLSAIVIGMLVFYVWSHEFQR